MSVESQLAKIVYSGNGKTTVFPVPFPYGRPEHLYVMITRENEVRENTSNFRVEQFENGDTNIIYPLDGEPLTSAERLTIYRQTPRTQILDLIYGGAFSPETLESDGFDRLCMMIQELGEESQRSIKLPIDNTGDADLTNFFVTMDKYQEACKQTLAEVQAEAQNITSNAQAGINTITNAAQEKIASIETTAQETLDTIQAKLDSIGEANQDNLNTLKTYVQEKLDAQTVSISSSSVRYLPSADVTLIYARYGAKIELNPSLPADKIFMVVTGPSGAKLVQIVYGTEKVLASLVTNAVYLIRHNGAGDYGFILHQLSSGYTLLKGLSSDDD